MINTDRIVPASKANLLDIYANNVITGGGTLTVIEASAPGEFTVSASITTTFGIANEPLKKLNFGVSASAGTVLFIPDYDYEGFYINGTFEEPADGSDAVDADGITLYKAVLSSGDITITKFY